MKVSQLLNPSMLQIDNGENSLKERIMGTGTTPLTSSFTTQDEPAFAMGASVNADSEIGEFIRMCQSAPPLKIFSMVESRSTVSRLLAENYNFSELSKLENMDINAS